MAGIEKDSKLKQVKYISKNKYTEPKSTPGGEFTFKDTGKDYKGQYFEDYKKRYFAGANPDSRGAELIKVKTQIPGQLLRPAVAFLAQAIQSLFKPKVKQSDKNKGNVTRYFVQSKSTKKISEVGKDDYVNVKTNLRNYNLATVDWNIKGPANDQMINGYPFEGAASKNKKAIQALESQMPGISTFVTNYSELVEEPVIKKDLALDSQTTVVEDPLTELENSRKANFDLRN